MRAILDASTEQLNFFQEARAYLWRIDLARSFVYYPSFHDTAPFRFQSLSLPVLASRPIGCGDEGGHPFFIIERVERVWVLTTCLLERSEKKSLECDVVPHTKVTMRAFDTRTPSENYYYWTGVICMFPSPPREHVVGLLDPLQCSER